MSNSLLYIKLNDNNMANLSIKYAGLNLSSPIIAASSGLTESVNNIKELELAGVGAVVLKSIFEEEILMEMDQVKQQMIGRPYVFPETMDYMDEEPHEDLIRKYLRLISETKKAVKIPIIASINCVSNQKWTYLAAEIEKAYLVCQVKLKCRQAKLKRCIWLWLKR